MAEALAIRPDADWIAAGENLVNGLAALPDEELRLRLLQQCCADLGDQLYPAFLKILCAIGRFGDAGARALTASVLARALATARLPSGRMAAWGARPAAAGGKARSFGPIEFICVWHMDQGGETPLDEETFATAARLLITLISASPEAASAYAGKLRQDVEEPLEGAYSRASRQLLNVFAESLDQGLAPDETLQRVLVAIRGIRAEASRSRWV